MVECLLRAQGRWGWLELGTQRKWGVLGWSPGVGCALRQDDREAPLPPHPPLAPEFLPPHHHQDPGGQAACRWGTSSGSG